MNARKDETNQDAMWQKWQELAPKIYDKIYYESNPLIRYINLSGHRLVEEPFGSNVEFANVLEVGAGTGQHLKYVKHSFQTYLLTDISKDLLSKAQSAISDSRAQFEIADATKLPYPDSSFDRLISIYNLEHLPYPHAVLEEWRRVVRPGGVISIAIPAEGGIPWNLGRHITTRRSFAKEGLDLDYIISREHINACYRLVSLIRYYFKNRSEKWFPLGIPHPHASLVYAVNLTNVK